MTKGHRWSVHPEQYLRTVPNVKADGATATRILVAAETRWVVRDGDGNRLRSWPATEEGRQAALTFATRMAGLPGWTQ